MAWRHEHDNPYIHIPETTGRPFPPSQPEPKPGDWDYRRRSGGMAVVELIAASSFLWGISGLLFWGMVAAFASDSGWGLVPLALGVLCWVAAAYVGVKAVYRILEFTPRFPPLSWCGGGARPTPLMPSSLPPAMAQLMPLSALMPIRKMHREILDNDR